MLVLSSFFKQVRLLGFKFLRSLIAVLKASVGTQLGGCRRADGLDFCWQIQAHSLPVLVLQFLQSGCIDHMITRAAERGWFYLVFHRRFLGSVAAPQRWAARAVGQLSGAHSLHASECAPAPALPWEY